jgi:hypothetical protein
LQVRILHEEPHLSSTYAPSRSLDPSGLWGILWDTFRIWLSGVRICIGITCWLCFSAIRQHAVSLPS